MAGEYKYKGNDPISNRHDNPTRNPINSYSEFKIKNSNLKGMQPTSTDNWQTTSTLTNYYDSNNKEPTFINKGTNPSFGTCIANISGSGIYYILWGNRDTLEVCSSISSDGYTSVGSLSASDAWDKIFPKRVILLLQGAGGGGGECYTSHAQGGGSGALITVILNTQYLKDNPGVAYKITIGAGGAGGSGANMYSWYRSGSGGGSSTLYLVYRSYPEDLSTPIITAGGGSGGPAGDGQWGGEGGTITVHNSSYWNYLIWQMPNYIPTSSSPMSGIAGRQGGKWHTGSHGGHAVTYYSGHDCSSTSDYPLYATNNSTGKAEWYNKLVLPGGTGGSGNENNDMGGGSASFFGDGGRTGGANVSFSGGPGAGGGAAQTSAGAGGDGVFRLYY